MSTLINKSQNLGNSKVPNDGKITLTEDNSSSTKRIASIDFVKGVAIGFIVLAHAALSWFDDDWRYIYGLIFALLDFVGPSLFVFLSALSVVFSIKKKKGDVPERIIRNKVFTRGLVIIIIGFLWNPMSLQTTGGKVPFPLNLWGWNFLMFIGFSQIFSYYALKFRKNARLLIGITIIFISPWLRQILFSFKDVNSVVYILHFIFTSPLPQIPFLPWIAVCFISTIFGEQLFEAMMKGTQESYYKLFRMFSAYGFSFILIGVFIVVPYGIGFNQWEPGWALQTPTTMGGNIEYSEYLHIDLLRIANQQSYTYFPGMPLFLIRGSAQNLFYNLGAALLIIAVSFYYIDIKKKSNDAIKMAIFYGNMSLSLFLIQYLFLPLFLGQFSIIFFPLVYIAYCGFLALLMYIWLTFFNGVGSPEWLMSQLGNLGKKKRKKS